MRQLALAAAMLLLVASLGCGKRKNAEVGGVSDTMPAAEATTPAPPEPAPSPAEFTFDQRQQFTESIRQQLAGIDAEIEQLASQAKSLGGAVSDRALARIRAARQAVSRDLKRVETATATNWNQVRGVVTRSVGNLEDAIEGAQPK
ncbi:MAG TPA: hypothetical protein VFU40_02585 [Gemmatimonadales bacterium]|nr:hypothetical protein [Gemmatimonadales bacterium]